MKGIREVYTAEQLFEELRPRLSLSDAWLAQQHPTLLRAADAMVEALQKKESYGGGVAQRAAHLAAHLKGTDPVLSRWMERQQALEAAKAAREAAAAAATETPRPDASGAGGGGSSSAAPVSTDATATAALTTTAPPSTPPAPPERQGGGDGAAVVAAPTAVEAATTSAEAVAVQPGGREAGAAQPVGSTAAPTDESNGGSGAGGSSTVSPKKSGSSKGGAATALEYLTTTFAHLREQRTLVMGDKKDRLLKEVAGLRQLRGGNINVLRGGRAAENTMADMLAALKAADADANGVVPAAVRATPVADAADAAAPMEVDGAPPAEGKKSGSSRGGGGGSQSPGKGHLDNLTCVVWEDWRIPERLDKLLRAGDSAVVYVEVHCRDGPEDTRLAMRLSTFVSLALCSQKLIAELYQDMFIAPQRAAAARPQRKRQRTAAEETVQTLDESTDSLDFVDFVEALHRRMPLRCGWMYANAILPTAREWDRIFGRQAGRLSGLYEGGSELDSLGRACLAFHQTRHESPVLDVHELASQLRQQQQQWHKNRPQQQPQRVPAGWPRNAVELASATAPSLLAEPPEAAATRGSGCCCSSPAAAGAEAEAALAPPPSSLILRSPHDSSGRGQGLDLGHLSFTCVTAAPLSDDFLGEVIRLTTAGQAAAEVAAAAAAAAALRANKCIASGGANCTGTCVADAAVAAAAAEAAAAAAADYASWGGLEGFVDGDGGEDDEERELFDAVNEELQAVEEAAVEAEREVELEMEMEGRVKKEEPAAAGAVGPRFGAGGACKLDPADGDTGLRRPCDDPHHHHHHHLKGAFSHRMQLLPGVFFSYYIGSQAFTNTAWHVEDFLLQSINLMMVGRPKAWWWVPRDKEAQFKEYLDDQWDAEEVFTKSVPLASVPLDKLIKMGVRRSVQLPGAIFITSPGYAFHTTMSAGWSMADSANFMANILGKDMHILEDERPLEQYPPTEGRTNTGEWVRFTMRRIEELRARNDPSYTPRPLRRIREQVEARRAAVKAKAAAAAAASVKSERDGGAELAEAEDRRVRGTHSHSHAPGHTTTNAQGGGNGNGNGTHKVGLKIKLKVHESALIGPQLQALQQLQKLQQLQQLQQRQQQQQQPQQQQAQQQQQQPQQQQQQSQQQQQQKPQPKPRQRNDAALLQAYVQAKAAVKAEMTAAQHAAAQRRQARVAARQGQPMAAAPAAPQPAAAAAAAPEPVPPAHASAQQPSSKRPSSSKSQSHGGKAKHSAPRAAVAAPPAASASPAPPAQPGAASKMAIERPAAAAAAAAAPQQQQQHQQLYPPPLQPFMMLMPEQPAALDLEAVCARVQPQTFSEQELLAGLLPGVLRGLLPEATVMIQQQRQQQRQQQQHQQQQQQPQQQPQQPEFEFLLRAPEQSMDEPAQTLIHQQQQQQQQALYRDGSGEEPQAAAALVGADEVMEEGAGAVAMEVTWRVAVA